MIHVGLQINFPLERLEEALKAVKVETFIDFDKEKSGIYIMSVKPLSTENIHEVHDSELIEECKKRGIIP